MRKKSGFTFVEQAIVLVPEFEMVVHKLEQQVTLRGQSRSTLQNYIRRIALFVIHFGKLPEKIDPEEINEYLAALARGPRSPSRSSFKHMVYGLRYYYRLLGMNREAIALPSPITAICALSPGCTRALRMCLASARAGGVPCWRIFAR